MNYTTLLTETKNGALHITLNRPESRNAMSFVMVQELMDVFSSVTTDRELRAIVLRGTGGTFCAGGDIKDLAKSRNEVVTEDCDPIVAHNREFGRMLQLVNKAPQAVIAVLEGAILGGGFGLACVSDIAIAKADCQFGLPETGLGLPPAQIAPFVVQRIGLTQARRLGVTGGRFDGDYAKSLGLVHEVAQSDDDIETLLASELKKVRRCAPGANAMTKQIMLDVYGDDIGPSLDYAATLFADAVRGKESPEGMAAFIEKRKPSWTES